MHVSLPLRIFDGEHIVSIYSNNVCSYPLCPRSLNGISAANGGAIPHVDKMLFNKMRQRRLGAVDARSVSPLSIVELLLLSHIDAHTDVLVITLMRTLTYLCSASRFGPPTSVTDDLFCSFFSAHSCYQTRPTGWRTRTSLIRRSQSRGAISSTTRYGI